MKTLSFGIAVVASLLVSGCASATIIINPTYGEAAICEECYTADLFRVKVNALKVSLNHSVDYEQAELRVFKEGKLYDILTLVNGTLGEGEQFLLPEGDFYVSLFEGGVERGGATLTLRAEMPEREVELVILGS
jgi:hypothetical protein